MLLSESQVIPTGRRREQASPRNAGHGVPISMADSGPEEEEEALDE